MSSIGTGYDLSVTSYSPEGRLFQIEYAQKAVKNSITSIGICCKDGVVFGVENIRINNLLEDTSNPRIFTIDKHIGFASSGWAPDASAIVEKAKEEAKEYKSFYGGNIPTKEMVEKISSHVHMYTSYWHLRPFGCSSLVGGYTQDGPELYMISPSGESWGYHAVAIGKGVQAAKSELEKLKLSQLTCREAVKEIARIIWKIHDFVKDKKFNLEMSWVCDETKRIHKKVPKKLVDDAIEYAKKKKKEDEEESDDEDDEDEMKDEGEEKKKKEDEDVKMSD